MNLKPGFRPCLCYFRDPNTEPGEDRGLGDWPLHSYRGREYIILDTTFHDHNRKPQVGNAYKVKDCAFWRDYVPTLMRTTGIYIVFPFPDIPLLSLRQKALHPRYRLP